MTSTEHARRPIWRFPAYTRDVTLLRGVLDSRACPTCNSGRRLDESDSRRESDGRVLSDYRHALVCADCGWWFLSHETYDSSCGTKPDHALHNVSAVGAALKIFSDFPDRSVLETLEKEVTEHLASRGTSSAWGALEDVTGAILRSFGYDARVTQRSKDDNVDVIIEHSDFGMGFVQVKHTRNKVGVRVFRELVGTMHISGVARGLLLTSSVFTAGVKDLQDEVARRGTYVELVDGNQVLSALRLTTRNAPPSLEEVTSLNPHLVSVVMEEVQI